MLRSMQRPGQTATGSNRNGGNGSHRGGKRASPTIAPEVTPLLKLLETEDCTKEDLQGLAESLRILDQVVWRDALIKLCGSKQTDMAGKLLTWLQAHRVCDSYDLLQSVVIHGLSKEKRLTEAFNLVDKLKLQGGTLGPMGYNGMVAACARQFRIQEAMEFLAQMREAGYQPDAVNYTLVFQACSKKRVSMDLIEKICEDIQREGLEMDTKLYNHFINACCKAGDPDRACNIWK